MLSADERGPRFGVHADDFLRVEVLHCIGHLLGRIDDESFPIKRRNRQFSHRFFVNFVYKIIFFHFVKLARFLSKKGCFHEIGCKVNTFF